MPQEFEQIEGFESQKLMNLFKTDKVGEFRSIDGSGNNKNYPSFGQTFTDRIRRITWRKNGSKISLV